MRSTICAVGGDAHEAAVSHDLALQNGLQLSELVGVSMVFELNTREVHQDRYLPALVQPNADECVSDNG